MAGAMNAPVLPPRGALQLRRGDLDLRASPRRSFSAASRLRAALCCSRCCRFFARIQAFPGGRLRRAVGDDADHGAFAGPRRLRLRGSGRKRIMVASLAALGVATLLPRSRRILSRSSLLRGLAGLALSGLPAVAMAYLADEIATDSLGLAMGLYIAGWTLGGMTGRLASAALADPRIGAARFLARRPGPRRRALLPLALPRERLSSQSPRRYASSCQTGRHFRRPGPEAAVRRGFPGDGRLRLHLQLRWLPARRGAVLAERDDDRLHLSHSTSSAL